MSRKIELKLPFPPSVNHYYVHTRRGVRISNRGKCFRADVQAYAIEHRRPKLTGRLSVKILLCAPNARGYDVDNYLKGLFDAMQNAKVYADDRQIDRFTVERGPIIPGGQCFVAIEEIGDMKRGD